MNQRRPHSDRGPNNGRPSEKGQQQGRSQEKGGQHGRNRRRRQGGGGSQRQEPIVEQVTKRAPAELKRYGFMFYDNHAQAREDCPRLEELSKQFDQLNIVIRAEGTMEDPTLMRFGKIYAGEAWYTIHKRREADGWYNEPHE